MSDNEITLVRPEREPMAVVERWDQEPTTETVRAMPSVPGGYFDFVQQYAGAPPAKPQQQTRPSPPPPELKASAVPPPPPLPEARVVVAPPPPPPPEPRSRAARTTEIPPPFAAPPLELQPTLRPPVAPAAYAAPLIRNAPSSLPPPVAIESHRQTARRQAAQVVERPWLSMFTIGPLSAMVAALVSSLLWSHHTRELQAHTPISSENPGGAAVAQAVPCTTRSGGSGTPAPEHGSSGTVVADGSSPASLATALQAPPGVTPQVSVDSLPTVGSNGAAKAMFAARSVGASDSLPAPRARSSRAREARPVDLSSAQARSSDAAEASASDSSEAAPAGPALPQGPDRAAVTKAMSRANRAAASCGTGPQDGRVSLTISPAGVVTSVSLVKGFGDAGVNACVLRAFSRAKVPAYEGDPIQVKKAVRW